MITLSFGIDVGQEINVGDEKFDKKNKHWALNKRRAWQTFEVFCNKKLEKIIFDTKFDKRRAF